MVEDAISFWTDIQRYEDMLAADPGSYCFAPLSELYRKLGLIDDAISVAQKGCDLHPDYPGGFFALGNAYHAKGLSDQARGALERAVLLTPDNLQALKLLGQLYAEAGDLPRAQKVLRQVVTQNPDDLESTLLLDSLASQVGAPQPEEELLEEVELIEELTELFDEEELAGAFQEAQEPEETGHGVAAAPAQEPAAQQKGGRDPLTTATLAELYVTQGHLDKALGIYRELLGADPGNQSYRSRCAEIAELQLQQQAQRQAPAPAAPAAAPQPVAPVAQQPGAAFAFESEPEPEPGAAHFDLDAGLELAEPAWGRVDTAPEQSPLAPGDLEAQLCSWLENIRRRRDGV